MFPSILPVFLLIVSNFFEPTTGFLGAEPDNTFDIFGEEFHYDYNYDDDKEDDKFYDTNKRLNEVIDLHYDEDEAQDNIVPRSHFVLDEHGEIYDIIDENNDESFYEDFVDEQADLKDSLVSICKTFKKH